MWRKLKFNNMKTSKINIGVSLSRNYDKITIDLLEEIVEHQDEVELRAEMEKKIEFLKDLVLEKLGEKEIVEPKTIQPKTTIPQKTTQKASKPQIDYLLGLGYEGETENLTKAEASILIGELKGEDY